MSSIKEKFKSKTLVDDEVSRFQQFLWWVAGAEKSILIECKTDYQKYFAIGSTILMTTIVAFFAGGSAAWYFSRSGEGDPGSIPVAIIFGLLWALLIFSIDRSLIVTIKKKEHEQNIWVPLLSRAALALLIAFMVSIPLELKIFEGFINTNSEKYADNLWNKDNESSSYTIKANKTKSRLLRDSSGLASAREELNKNAENEDRKNLVREKRKQENLKRAPTDNDIQSWIKQRNQSDYQDRVLELNGKINSRKIQIQISAQSKIVEINKKLKLYLVNDSILNSHITSFNDSITNNSTLITQFETLADKQADSTRSKALKSNRFIWGYQVLDYGVYKRKDGSQASISEILLNLFRNKKDISPLEEPATLFFLWLIRTLFFLIEILPTIVKLAMKFGNYDRRVLAEEESLKAHFDSQEYQQSLTKLTLTRVNAKQEVLDEQLATEKELRGELIKKISDTQKEVTEAYLKDWKENELQKIQKRHNFIQYTDNQN